MRTINFLQLFFLMIITSSCTKKDQELPKESGKSVNNITENVADDTNSTSTTWETEFPPEVFFYNFYSFWGGDLDWYTDLRDYETPFSVKFGCTVYRGNLTGKITAISWWAQPNKNIDYFETRGFGQIKREITAEIKATYDPPLPNYVVSADIDITLHIRYETTQVHPMRYKEMKYSLGTWETF